MNIFTSVKDILSFTKIKPAAKRLMCVRTIRKLFTNKFFVAAISSLAPPNVNLSLPRVINLKFPLKPHQNYYITQYGELGFL